MNGHRDVYSWDVHVALSTSCDNFLCSLQWAFESSHEMQFSAPDIKATECLFLPTSIELSFEFSRDAGGYYHTWMHFHHIHPLTYNQNCPYPTQDFEVGEWDLNEICKGIRVRFQRVKVFEV